MFGKLVRWYLVVQWYCTFCHTVQLDHLLGAIQMALYLVATSVAIFVSQPVGSLIQICSHLASRFYWISKSAGTVHRDGHCKLGAKVYTLYTACTARTPSDQCSAYHFAWALIIIMHLIWYLPFGRVLQLLPFHWIMLFRALPFVSFSLPTAIRTHSRRGNHLQRTRF